MNIINRITKNFTIIGLETNMIIIGITLIISLKHIKYFFFMIDNTSISKVYVVF